MRMIQRLALAAALAALCSAAPAQNAPYRFEPLGERPRSPSSGDLVRRLPALNDSGTAAFIVGTATGHYGQTLYTGTPGNVRQVETPGVSVGGGVSINNHGRIGFIGLGTGEPAAPGMFAVTAGGPVVSIAVGSFDFEVPTGHFETAISDSGAVMALSDQPQRFPSSVIIGDGTGPAQRVFSTPQPPLGTGGVVLLTSPRMSARGDWTAFETNINGSPNFYTAVHSSGGSRSSIFGGAVGSSDVAGDGVVVYQGTPAVGGGRALYTFRDNTGGGIIPGSEALPRGTVAMNDAGVVALLEGQTQGEGTRLWLLRDGVTETVLSAGDPLLGSTVSTIGFDPKGFNNSNQFAMLVGLADGRDVFVLASPVPEPGAVGLAFGTAMLLLPRRRHG